MPTPLSYIENHPTLLAHLMDNYDWPINEDAAPDDLTFDYDATELGIDKRILEKVKLQSLRPLSANQPWAILLFDFGTGKVRLGELRKTIRAFVPKKRAWANPGNRQLFDLEHILCVCTHGTDDGTGFTFYTSRSPKQRAAPHVYRHSAGPPPATTAPSKP